MSTLKLSYVTQVMKVHHVSWNADFWFHTGHKTISLLKVCVCLIPPSTQTSIRCGNCKSLLSSNSSFALFNISKDFRVHCLIINNIWHITFWELPLHHYNTLPTCMHWFFSGHCWHNIPLKVFLWWTCWQTVCLFTHPSASETGNISIHL